MAEEVVTQSDYTTVQLRRDLHKSVRIFAVNRDTDVKTVIENAVVQYLAAAQTQREPMAVSQ